MRYTELARVLRDAGLPVVEESGWKTRGKEMSDVRTITCHHTANGGASGNAPSLRVVREGRTGLAGPLSQLFLAKDGTWHVVASGRANHAGVSLETRFDNDHAIGIEAEAEGTPGARGDWPEQQMASYARGCAALVRHFKLSVADVRGHKETCKPAGRKIDPSFSMPNFRKRVGAVNLDQQEEGMELSDEIKLTATGAKVISIPGHTPRAKGDPLSVSYLLQWGGPGLYRVLGHVQHLRAENAAMRAQLAALTTAVGAIAAGSTEAIQAAFTEGSNRIRAELAELEVRVSLVDDDDEPEQ